MLLGLDGSNNNEWTGFRATVRAGYRFAWWKVTEGTYFADPTWEPARHAMHDAGLAHGGYHYGIPRAGRPREEARHFVEHLAATPWLLLPFLDVEEQGSEGVGTAALEEWCLTFAEEACNELRVERLILYANGDLLYNRGLDTPAMRRRFLLDFAAPQPHRPAFPAHWETVLWQFDWHGAVPGFRGAVDRDYLLPPHELHELTMHALTPRPKATRPRRHAGQPAPLPHGA